MKHVIYILLGILVSFTFYSCQNDDDIEIPAPLPSRVGSLYDGSQISAVEFYSRGKFVPADGVSSTHTDILNNYSELEFRVAVVVKGLGPQTKEMATIDSLVDEFYKEKTQFIAEDYHRYEAEGHKGDWPYFFTAYTDGEVTITCDKTLFGKLPGTNLSKFFDVAPYSGCLATGIENPKLCCKFGDELPANMEQFFEKESWLQVEYNLKFNEMPSEKYDSLTFELTLPMLIEHARDYVVAKQKNVDAVVKYTKSIAKVQCHVKFKWN